MALKRGCCCTLTWGQAVDLGGLAEGPPNLYFLAMLESRSLAFSCLSGRVPEAKATGGFDFDPFGRPRRLGGSAGPKSPSGTWQRCAPLMPHGSANRDDPGAGGALYTSVEEDDDGSILRAATCSCSGCQLDVGRRR